MKLKVGIITASDKGYAGERVDESGPAIRVMVEEKGWEVMSFPCEFFVSFCLNCL